MSLILLPLTIGFSFQAGKHYQKNNAIWVLYFVGGVYFALALLGL
jgi:hypothetical protein